MITLTLSENNGNEDIFVNPMHIICIMQNDKGFTEIICVDQTVIGVKETPTQVFNLINNRVNYFREERK